MWKKPVCNRALMHPHSPHQNGQDLAREAHHKNLSSPRWRSKNWYWSLGSRALSSVSEAMIQLFSTDLKKRADVYLLACKLCPNVWIERIEVAQYIFKCLEGVEARLAKECCSWGEQNSFTNPNISQEKACLFPNGFPPLSLMLWTAVQINIR